MGVCVCVCVCVRAWVGGCVMSGPGPVHPVVGGALVGSVRALVGWLVGGWLVGWLGWLGIVGGWGPSMGPVA